MKNESTSSTLRSEWTANHCPEIICLKSFLISCDTNASAVVLKAISPRNSGIRMVDPDSRHTFFVDHP
jgi:hypothetical protein